MWPEIEKVILEGHDETTVGNHGWTSGIHCNVFKSKFGSSMRDSGVPRFSRAHASARFRRYCVRMDLGQYFVFHALQDDGTDLSTISVPVANSFLWDLA